MTRPVTKDALTQSATPPSLASAHIEVGRKLGDFLLLEKLGDGGASTVFRARQESLSRDAVVKVLRTRAHEHTAKQRFEHEASVAIRLDHPYAAHVYAYGVERDGLMWIAMEFVRGVSLDQMIAQRGRLSVGQFVGLFEHLCEVVHTAHEQGIIHRDIKPANVMIVARAGRLLPKLLDFGIAGVVRNPDRRPRKRPSPPPTAATKPTLEVAPVYIEDDDASQPPPALIDIPDLPNDPDRGTVFVANDSKPSSPARLREDSRPWRARLLGTPCFMSPEQWLDPLAVDHRTDVYALGILAYEALVGRPPFTARSLEEMARAHVEGEVPDLGSDFPRALNDVLHRALAKDKTARFDSTLEFATALRRACGFGEESPTALVALDDDLVDAFILRAPLPLAEAIVVAQGARNFDHARNAFLDLLTVWARVLGILALACRINAGRRSAVLAPAPRRLLRTLRERDLAACEWIELALELTLPWTGRADVHPIPELVAFLHAPEQPDLLALVRDLQVGLEQGFADPVVSVSETSSTIETLLRTTEFILVYSWNVPEDDGLTTSWMGLQGGRPTVASIADREYLELPFIASRDGVALVSLGPLALAAAPHPGASRKLFLLAGPGRTGARMLAEPHGFVRDDDRVWEFLAPFVGELTPVGSHTPREDVPYKGLSSFDREDSSLFFGRDREIEIALNRLKALPLLAIVGPSGTGKSSLAFAGIVPQFPSARVIALRPGRRPLEALATAFTRAGLELEESRVILAPEGCAEVVLARIREGTTTTLIVIDQFEELFTLGSDGPTQAIFAAFLARLSTNPADPVRILLTVRDDFLVQSEQLSALRGRIAYGLQLLTTPPRDELIRIVQEPAQRMGYRFEDDELVAEMVDEVQGQPGALALLSFTAAELWSMRDTAFRRLLRRSHRELGGVGGALAQHAEQVLSSMDVTAQSLVRRLLRQLVTAERTRATLSRAEIAQLFGPSGEVVLERLLTARLLTASEGEDGSETRIELCHEALLTAWPRLVRWQEEDREGQRLHEQLRAAARQWDTRGRPQGLLWRGEALVEYRLWRARHDEPLTELESAFGRASEAASYRTSRIRRNLVLAAVILLMAFAATVTWQRNTAVSLREVADRRRHEAETQRNEARAAHARANALVAALLRENARREALADEPIRAMTFLTEARAHGSRGPATDFLTRRALDSLEHQSHAFLPMTGEVKNLVAHAGMVAASSNDGFVRLWNSTGKLITELDLERVHDLDIHPDGRVVMVATDQGVRLWSDKGEYVTAFDLGRPVWRAGFSPDGRRIVFGHSTPPHRLWSYPQAEEIAALDQSGPIIAIRFTGDGRQFATASFDEVRLWAAANGKLLHTLPGRDSPGSINLEFARDDEVLVTSQYEGETRAWSTRTGQTLAILEPGPITRPKLSVSGDGAVVASAGANGTTRLYETETFAPITTLTGHDGAVTQVLFTADGQRVITGGLDGLIRMWDRETGEHLGTFGTHIGEFKLTLLDARTLISGGADGRVLAWTSEPHERMLRWSAHDGGIWQLAYNRGGTKILTAGDDGYVRVWERQTGRLLHERRPDAERTYERTTYHHHLFAAWHPDERRVAVVAGEGVVVWDLLDDAHETTLPPIRHEIYFASWNEAGTALALGGEAGAIYLWDGERMRRFHDLPKGERIWGLDFDPTGQRLVSHDESPVAKIWNVATGELERTLTGHTGPLVRGSFDATGTRVITASHDKTARIWDTATGRSQVVLTGHHGYLFDGVFTPDGELVATVSGDGELIVWEAASGMLLRRYQNNSKFVTMALEFSPDGTEVAAAGADGIVRVWNVRRAPIPEQAELASLVRCRVPYRLDGERLSPDPSELRRCAATSSRAGSR